MRHDVELHRLIAEGTLSKVEIKRLGYEARKEKSDAIRKDLDDFHEERAAAALGLSSTGTGKRINRMRHKETSRHLVRQNDIFLTDIFAGGVNVLKDLITSTWVGYFSQAAEQSANANGGATKARDLNDPLYAYEDENFVYETTLVSQTTAQELARETQILQAKIEELEAADCPDTQKALAHEILELAEKFHMREHPITKAFVHELESVEALEQKNNPKHMERLCTAEVCVARFKGGAMDSRTIKRTISDVYNPDVAEVELTQDEKAAVEATKPVPPRLELTYT